MNMAPGQYEDVQMLPGNHSEVELVRRHAEKQKKIRIDVIKLLIRKSIPISCLFGK